jgi:hypothetical protein
MENKSVPVSSTGFFHRFLHNLSPIILFTDVKYNPNVGFVHCILIFDNEQSSK